MPTRLQTFVQRPWIGGLNTARDAALLGTDELQLARNCVFDHSGSRKSRGGLQLWDYVGTGVQRSSSGTTRTIRATFNAGATPSTSINISVFHPSASNGNYDIQEVTPDTVVLVSGTTYDITYTMSTTLTEGVTADTQTRVGFFDTASLIIGLYDYWYESSGTQTQKRVAVTADGNFWLYASDGSRTSITVAGGVTITTPLSNASFAVLGNKLVIALEGGTTSQNYPLIWDGSSNIDYLTNLAFDGTDVGKTGTAANNAPNLKVVRTFQSRIMGIEKGVPNRIHYSDVSEPERWNGEGDSGALEIEAGDGDSSGFTAIFPPFKGRLIVAKGNQLYQIVGEIPLQGFQIISDGVGCLSNSSAVAIDQDDIAFISRKGLHSLAATDQYGDFVGSFLSSDIQPTFDNIDTDALDEADAVYIPKLNSIAWAVRTSGTGNNEIFLYNVLGKQWYIWDSEDADFSFNSMSTFIDDKVRNLYAGTTKGRVVKYVEDYQYDFVSDDIEYRVTTGIIYPDSDPSRIKGFKQVGILYKTDRNAVDVDIYFKIDNYQTQIGNVSQTSASDLLGTTFTLGSSTLGAQNILLPEHISVDGYGYGCVIELRSTSPIEVYGYSIQYELAGDQREVIRNN
jgi:hypothetical protein